MTQQTLDNGDSLLIQRTKINDNATDAETRLTELEDNPNSTGYSNTVYVDADNGSADYDGKDPSYPTTLSNAISNLAFSTCLVFAESTNPYTTGGTIVIDQSNITMQAIQGGTGSNSIIISDDITINTGITRLRAHGMRFDGTITDNGDGRNFMTWCSLGGTGSIVINDPKNYRNFTDCDLQSGSISISGTGSSNSVTRFSGSTMTLPNVTFSASSHVTYCYGHVQCGTVNLTAGSLFAETASFVGTGNVIDASSGTTVRLRDTQCLSLVLSPQQVSLDGSWSLNNVNFDRDNSTLTGTEFTGALNYFSSDVIAPNLQAQTDLTDHTSDFSVTAWNTLVRSVNNTSDEITVTLPNATIDDIGKKIEFWIKGDTFLNHVNFTTNQDADSINDVAIDSGNRPVGTISSHYPSYNLVTSEVVSENDIHINFIDNVSNPSGSDGVLTASVDSGGAGLGVTDGDYTALQISSDGSGFGAIFTLTVASNAVTAVVSVDNAGSGYAVNEKITCGVISDGSWFLDPVINVDSIG